MQKKETRLAALMLALLMAFATSQAEETPAEEAALPPMTHSVTTRIDERDAVVSGEQATVDFSMLAAVNEDIVGWLYQEETRLSTPVMRSPSKGYYLNRGVDQSYLPRSRGSVSLNVDGTLTDDIVRITGDGSMAGPLGLLADYTSQEGYEHAPALRLLTPQGDRLAEVFASFWHAGELDIPENAQERAQWVRDRQTQSLIQPIYGAEPLPDEQMLVMRVRARDSKDLMVCATLRPLRYNAEHAVDLNKVAMDARETYNGYVTVEGVGRFMVYAQNDPLWEDLRYEGATAGVYREFGDGGCGPTAVALAVANLIPEGELPKLRNFAAVPQGTLFCEDSVNRFHCSHLHAPYQLVTQQEYLRYLPVALADFAAGNNRWNVRSRNGNARGTNMNFLKYVCEVYGISLSSTRRVDEALSWIAEKPGRMAVACSTNGSPFTSSSHYVTIAAANDEWFYVLDPLRRESYDQWDRFEVVEVLAPGVLRIRREDAALCNLSPFSLMEKEAQP